MVMGRMPCMVAADFMASPPSSPAIPSPTGNKPDRFDFVQHLLKK
jgi:hypothetical protein